MHTRKVIPAILVAAFAALALAATPALALKEYVSEVSFGEPCSENPCGKGQFNEPTGVAVNDSGGLVEGVGDVYVVDSGDNRVERFDAAGVYEGQFDGSGTYEVAGKVEKGPAAPSGAFSAPVHVAVDDAKKSVLEDPSLGDVYVIDEGHQVIDKFSPTGEYLAQLSETTTNAPFETLRGVAVDPAGDLWVYEEIFPETGREGKIDEFSDTGSSMQSFKTGRHGSFRGGLAVDSRYVYVGEENEVSKFEVATGKEVATFYTTSFVGQGVVDLALNPTTDNLLLDGNESSQESPTEVLVYGPGGEPYGKPLQALPAEPPFSFSRGLAVNGEGTVYVSERGADAVKVFDYVLFPAVSTEQTTVGQGEVTLHGLVNPEGEEVTECQFEYGTETGEYTHTLPCAPKAPYSGSESVSVSANPTGLEPRTTYRFRLTAHAKATKSSGEDAFFTSTQPLVENQSAINVGSAVATVQAQVDAAGLPTTYHVEYGTSASYGSNTQVTGIGAPTEGVSVTVQLKGLEPGVEYHYRFVASNAFGTTPGGDAYFDTPAAAGGSASTLPDERVYELVSTSSGSGEGAYDPVTPQYLPEDISTEQLFQAAADGNAVAYLADPARSGGNGSVGLGLGNEWLATRSAEGWTTGDITPVGSEGGTAYEAFSSNLATGIVESRQQPPLTADAPPGCKDLYSRSSDGGAYRALFTTTDTPEVCGDPHFAGATTDGSQILFQSEAALTHNARAALEVPSGHEGKHDKGGTESGEPCEFGCNLYDSVGGQLRLVNVLPNGKTVANANFGGYSLDSSNRPDFSNTISADGSRIFWTDTQEGPEMEHIYVLENGTSTVAVSGAGAAQYWAATPDGRYAYYTEDEKLWRFDTDDGSHEALASEGLNGENAGVQGVLGVNNTGEDGAYVYFVATAVLAAQENANGERAEAGQDNLYLRHAGTTTFIATLSAEDDLLSGTSTYTGETYGDWQPNLGNRTAEVTPDGRHLVFESQRSLTGYRNVNADDKHMLEVFVYSADAGRLSCASCDPTGAAPGLGFGTEHGTLLPISASDTYMRRWISEDGSQVFFDSFQSLAPQDSNGVQDVYEWESEGSPSCPESAPPRRDEGCVFLLSSGESSDYSYLVDASASGNDVFFTTRSRLVSQDGDEKNDLYDARVDGYRPITPPLCTGSGCQGVPPAAPIFATPSSVTFNGVGNFEPSPRSVVKSKVRHTACKDGAGVKRGKCVKKTRKKTRKKSSKVNKPGGRSTAKRAGAGKHSKREAK